MLLFITICCTDFYLFVLYSSLLIYSLSHFVPALYSTVGSWCILALHVVSLPRNSTGLRLFPFYCFVLDYPFINQILHFFPFLSSHFAHVNVLKFLTITPIRFSSITECLSKLHWLPRSLLSQPLASTLLAEITLLRLLTTHTHPCINSMT